MKDDESDADIETLRASAVPLALACPASIRGDGVQIDIEHEASGMGTAAHAVFESIVAGLQPDVEEYAKHYSVNPAELGMLARFARIAWDDLRAEFPGAETELALSCRLIGDVTLTGHLDLFARFPKERRAALADLKTGRLDADYKGQVFAYCVLVFENDPEIDEIDASVIWLRDSEIERYRVTREEAAAWKDALIERVVEWDGVYHPNPKCGHCPRNHECEALVAMARRDIAVFGDAEMAANLSAEKGLDDVPDATLVALKRKAQVLSALLDQFDTVLRATVRKRGVVDSGDGQILKFIDTEQREVDALAAWPVLQSHLSDEEIAARVTVSISRIEDHLAKKAGKGKGAAAKRALAAELDAVQAVSTRTVSQLRLVRK